MIGLLLNYLWLQWQSGYSDTFPMSRRCHCKRGPLYHCLSVLFHREGKICQAQQAGRCKICFQANHSLHFSRNTKSFKMRYISWNSDEGLLRYGNPGSCFWKKNYIFTDISYKWVKMRQNLIFFISFSNFTIWQPWYLGLGQEKFQKIISAIIDKNTLLDTWFEGFSPYLIANVFFRTISNLLQKVIFPMPVSIRHLIPPVPKRLKYG